MTVFEKFKSNSIDELVEWLNEYGVQDYAPWDNWFNDNYCSKCESIFDPKYNQMCAWCESHEKCKYFLEMNNIPDPKQVIKMWLESEA